MSVKKVFFCWCTCCPCLKCFGRQNDNLRACKYVRHLNLSNFIIFRLVIFIYSFFNVCAYFWNIVKIIEVIYYSKRPYFIWILTTSVGASRPKKFRKCLHEKLIVWTSKKKKQKQTIRTFRFTRGQKTPLCLANKKHPKV